MIAHTLTLVIPRLPKISLRHLAVPGFILVAFLLIFYIFQVNEITRGGFLISNYERKMAELSQQNKNLEIYFSQNNSLANLESLFGSSNYEKIDKIRYIRILDGSVVYEELED